MTSFTQHPLHTPPHTNPHSFITHSLLYIIIIMRNHILSPKCAFTNCMHASCMCIVIHLPFHALPFSSFIHIHGETSLPCHMLPHLPLSFLVSHLLLNVTHNCCFFFFFCMSATKLPTISLLHSLCNPPLLR